MGIPKGHAELTVAEELLDLLEAPALHDEPARAGVSEVVEAKVLDLGLYARSFKRSAYAAPRSHPAALAEHEASRFALLLALCLFWDCRTHYDVTEQQCSVFA